MSENKKLVPKRRFKEFQNTGAWEQRKLGDEVEFYSGLTYSPSDVIEEGGTFVLRSSNVKNGKIVNADNVYVNSDVANSDNVREGDVIVVVRNGSCSLIGKHALIKQNMNNTVIGAFMTGIHSEQSAFINVLLNTAQFDKEIEKNLGATINQITTGAFKKMQFMFPDSDEQTSIGLFFQHFDNLVTLHQRKLEKTKALKAAYLSEMFPAEGERKPKRRFKGFTDDWEQGKFKDIVVRSSTSNDEDGLPRVEYEDIISGQGALNKDIFAKISDKKGIEFEVGDVLFGKLRPYLQNWLLAGFKGVAVGDWWVLRPENYDSKFVYSLIQSKKYQTVANLSAGTKMPRSDWNVVSNTLFDVTKSIEEQTLIGQFFQQLDALITLHQRKLEKLQNIKKAYLNEMFVGGEQ